MHAADQWNRFFFLGQNNQLSNVLVQLDNNTIHYLFNSDIIIKIL